MKNKKGEPDASNAQQALAGLEMKIEYWPIETPIDYARNARKFGSTAIAKVAASIREFGFVQPIVVDKDGVIVIGHLRRTAARSLGMEQVPVMVADKLTPAQVKALRVMDNRSHDEAVWDNELLGPEIMEIKGMDLDLKLTGFNVDEIQGFVLDGWEPAVDEVLSGSASGSAEATESAAAERGLAYRIVVECESEMQQTELLQDFENRGLKCKPLIS